MGKVVEELSSFIDALYPIIYIPCLEVEDLDKIIRNAADKREIVEFDNGMGVIDFTNKSLIKRYSLLEFLKQIFDKPNGEDLLIVLRNIEEQIENLEVVSLLNYIAKKHMYNENYNVSIVIVSNKLNVPEKLNAWVTIVEPSIPDVFEVRNQIIQWIRDFDMDVSEDIVDEFTLSLYGLNEFQILKIFYLAYQNGGNLYFTDKYLIQEQKAQLLKKERILEVVTANESVEDIGGLENLKEWLYQKEFCFKHLIKAKKSGVDNSKGIMILGMPGCGKSLIAKATAKLFDVPLVRFTEDGWNAYCSHPEKMMKKVLGFLDMISPCVFWIDVMESMSLEIEQLLIRIQEKERPVFVSATINDISMLSSTLFKRNLFDEWFYVNLPNYWERKRIIKIHLQKRKKWNEDLDIGFLAKITEGYNGAELEAMVRDAVEKAFIQERDKITTEDLEDAQKKIKAASEVFRENIQKIEEISQCMGLIAANHDENKIAVKWWEIDKKIHRRKEMVDFDAVTLYETLGKDWWKKPNAKFTDRSKQNIFVMESGFCGYGIGLI